MKQTKKGSDANRTATLLVAVAIAVCLLQCTGSNSAALKLKKGAHIISIGNNLGSRMMDFGYFETEM